MRVLTLLVTYLVAGIAGAASTDDIMAKCWENRGHPEMSQCVRDRARQSRAELEKLNREIRVKLAAVPRDEYLPGYVARLRKYLDPSDEAYRRYRTAACSLHFEFSAYGTGPNDTRYACESVLDDQRTAELREAGWWLWQ
jgi:uncharacterized protein YecT (DUF1311 family)